MQIRFTVEDILEILKDGRRWGVTDRDITGIASLQEAEPGDLSFLGNRKYRQHVAESNATVILVPEDYDGEPRKNQILILVNDPSRALALLCERVERELRPVLTPGVDPCARIDPLAAVHPTARIGPMCVIEPHVLIGKECNLEARVFVGRYARIGSNCCLSSGAYVGSYCILGDRVSLMPGAVIGSDGFGYVGNDGAIEKIPQIGNVELEDDVEIGANSTIDRARFGETRIGRGSKIDNLVHIAHNVRIGENCLIAAQTGGSGSTVIESGVEIGGQVGLDGHINIGKESRLGAQAGISKDLPPGSKVTGTPAYSFLEDRRIEVLKRRLPELFKRVSNLENLGEDEKESL